MDTDNMINIPDREGKPQWVNRLDEESVAAAQDKAVPDVRQPTLRQVPLQSPPSDTRQDALQGSSERAGVEHQEGDAPKARSVESVPPGEETSVLARPPAETKTKKTAPGYTGPQDVGSIITVDEPGKTVLTPRTPEQMGQATEQSAAVRGALDVARQKIDAAVAEISPRVDALNAANEQFTRDVTAYESSRGVEPDQEHRRRYDELIARQQALATESTAIDVLAKSQDLQGQIDKYNLRGGQLGVSSSEILAQANVLLGLSPEGVGKIDIFKAVQESQQGALQAVGYAPETITAATNLKDYYTEEGGLQGVKAIQDSREADLLAVGVAQEDVDELKEFVASNVPWGINEKGETTYLSNTEITRLEQETGIQGLTPEKLDAYNQAAEASNQAIVARNQEIVDARSVLADYLTEDGMVDVQNALSETDEATRQQNLAVLRTLGIDREDIRRAAMAVAQTTLNAEFLAASTPWGTDTEGNTLYVPKTWVAEVEHATGIQGLTKDKYDAYVAQIEQQNAEFRASNVPWGINEKGETTYLSNTEITRLEQETGIQGITPAKLDAYNAQMAQAVTQLPTEPSDALTVLPPGFIGPVNVNEIRYADLSVSQKTTYDAQVAAAQLIRDTASVQTAGVLAVPTSVSAPIPFSKTAIERKNLSPSQLLEIQARDEAILQQGIQQALGEVRGMSGGVPDTKFIERKTLSPDQLLEAQASDAVAIAQTAQTVEKLAIGLVPIVGTVAFWNEMPTWGKVLSIAADAAFVSPLLRTVTGVRLIHGTTVPVDVAVHDALLKSEVMTTAILTKEVADLAPMSKVLLGVAKAAEDAREVAVVRALDLANLRLAKGEVRAYAEETGTIVRAEESLNMAVNDYTKALQNWGRATEEARLGVRPTDTAYLQEARQLQRESVAYREAMDDVAAELNHKAVNAGINPRALWNPDDLLPQIERRGGSVKTLLRTDPLTGGGGIRVAEEALSGGRMTKAQLAKWGAGVTGKAVSAVAGMRAIPVPVETPVVAPVAVPVGTPVVAPVAVPVGTPVVAPVAVPVETPVVAPVAVPVETPVVAPVAVPVETPVVAPVAVPVETPVVAPVAVPVETPVVAPVAVPTPAPAPMPALARTPATVRSAVPSPLLLPPSVSFTASQYPRIVEWPQGGSLIRKDLLSGFTTYRRNPGDVTQSPWDGFKVIRKSTTPPKRQRLDLGVVDVLVSPTGLRFVQSMDSRTLPTPRVQSPLRKRRGSLA